MREKMAGTILDIFERTFGDAVGARVFFAPGRVNLIGEHTDYNGGYVLPCALEMGTYCAVRRRDDRRLRMYSENFPEAGMVEWDLDNVVYRKEAGWSNYPAGVVWALRKKSMSPGRGFDIAFLGDIPNGAGLSSSASIEVLTGYALDTVYKMGIPLPELALAGQYAENNFVGMNCGIMDQCSIALGSEGKAVFLDTARLSYEYVPLTLGKYCIMIMNTRKRRGLADSKYNERRAECNRALAALQSELDITHLCELDEAQFEEYKYLIADKTERKRAKHVVCENARTIQAKKMLMEGRLAELGILFNESHCSLQEDYEVTGVELDALVYAAQAQEGVLGARMTGAGFGGCAICIAEQERVKEIIGCVGAAYVEKIGYEVEFYKTVAGGGPVELTVGCGGED